MLVQQSLLEDIRSPRPSARSRASSSGSIPDWSFDPAPRHSGYRAALRRRLAQGLRLRGGRSRDRGRRRPPALRRRDRPLEPRPTSRPPCHTAATSILSIDEGSRKNLEIVRNIGDSGKAFSLIAVLDHTKTAPGRACSRTGSCSPSARGPQAEARLDAVDFLYRDQRLLASLRESLGSVGTSSASPPGSPWTRPTPRIFSPWPSPSAPARPAASCSRRERPRPPGGPRPRRGRAEALARALAIAVPHRGGDQGRALHPPYRGRPHPRGLLDASSTGFAVLKAGSRGLARRLYRGGEGGDADSRPPRPLQPDHRVLPRGLQGQARRRACPLHQAAIPRRGRALYDGTALGAGERDQRGDRADRGARAEALPRGPGEGQGRGRPRCSSSGGPGPRATASHPSPGPPRQAATPAPPRRRAGPAHRRGPPSRRRGPSARGRLRAQRHRALDSSTRLRRTALRPSP